MKTWNCTPAVDMKPIFDVHDVQGVLKRAKVKKSPGPDGIKRKTAKKLCRTAKSSIL